MKDWIKQAKSAIKQGQSLNDFVSHCHASNRSKAKTAYRQACNCCRQIPGQDGVYKQDKLDKQRRNEIRDWLKRFDAVQKRTAKSKLQLP